MSVPNLFESSDSKPSEQWLCCLLSLKSVNYWASYNPYPIAYIHTISFPSFCHLCICGYKICTVFLFSERIFSDRYTCTVHLCFYVFYDSFWWQIALVHCWGWVGRWCREEESHLAGACTTSRSRKNHRQSLWCRSTTLVWEAPNCATHITLAEVVQVCSTCTSHQAHVLLVENLELGPASIMLMLEEARSFGPLSCPH